MSPSRRAAPRTPVADMTVRMRRRRQRVWRRRLLTALVVALLAALVGGAVWLVGFSPVLAVRTVRVTGVQALTSEQVSTVAAVPLGVPLARVPLDDVAARVEAVPQVADARVVRVWPSTVEIAVTERVPVFIAVTRADGMRLVDGEGRPYEQIAEPRPGLVMAQLPDGASERVHRDVATLAKALTPALAEGQLQVDSPDALQLRLRDDRVVFFGSVDDIAVKVDVATKLLAATSAKVYDVSAPSRPVTR